MSLRDEVGSAVQGELTVERIEAVYDQIDRNGNGDIGKAEVKYSLGLYPELKVEAIPSFVL